ncbi:MAG: glycosyltransferase family 4 protein [Brumimicrobium sp.]|nr:glycosyltransferase family 4 protein [Brumimicrobium sp.]
MSRRIFILAPYPRGEAPSQRFRFEQYLPMLEKEGFDIHFHSFLDNKTWNTLYSEGKYFAKATGILKSFFRRWKILFSVKKSDHVFIHREAAHIGPPIFEWYLAKIRRINYIYDFDDAIWLPNYSASNAKVHRFKAYWKVKYCMKWAHRITAGNEYLKQFAEKYNPNVQIIPTTIDLKNQHTLKSNHNASPTVIGWTGTHTTMHYLDEIIPVIEELEKNYRFIFRVISNKAPNYKLKSLEFIKWNKTSEIEDLSQLNIGLMPLKEDKWSKGKCGFKALQYMALEIATVLSPVGVNTEIVDQRKNGLFADNPDAWRTALEQLLTDVNFRTQIAKAGRIQVKERYSVEALAGTYLNLFKP